MRQPTARHPVRLTLDRFGLGSVLPVLRADGPATGFREVPVADGVQPADEVVIATKGRFPMGEGPNDVGTSRRHLLSALDASLERLGVQLQDNLGAVDLDLTAAELGKLTDASAPRIDDYPYGTAGVAQRHRRLTGGR